ncbi:MAG TPA: ABC transporter ATP-binding protein [Thermotogota bacterium]|nr:ABC transporter ATP-binding protein [Thermotogota bacterium]HRW92273.1 ABC transporter ATP-binding protein [Thermotogota bacterium]
MQTILEMKGITKFFPANQVHALDGVDLQVNTGAIHALVGENGAGKTTLMRILNGWFPANSGSMVFKGEKAFFRSPAEAFAHGIGMVHQHFRLVEDFSVVQNVVLGVEPRVGKLFASRHVPQKLQQVAQESQITVDFHARVKDLSIGDRQKVTLLRLLYRDSDFLILDEPTSVLTPLEAKGFFNILLTLQSKGKTIVWVSHHLHEVKQYASEVSVLRKGKMVFSGSLSSVSVDKLSEMMVGESVKETYQREPPPKRSAPVLSVSHFSLDHSGHYGRFEDVSLELFPGEIQGIAGVSGSGQSALAHCIAGLLEPSSGTLSYQGKDIVGESPRELREQKLVFVPEDRLHEGSCVHASISENWVVSRYYHPPFSREGRLQFPTIQEQTLKWVRDFQLDESGLKDVLHFEVGFLSGGNIQKVLLSRELSHDPRVLVVCDPTWGLDVKSTRFVREKLLELRQKGCAILLVSADLDELLELSDWIGVFFNGRLVGNLQNYLSSGEESPAKLPDRFLVSRYMTGISGAGKEQAS